jgi:hypothetical protein
MRDNGSGPASVATEGEARKMDRLAGSIASENKDLARAVKFHPLADIFPLMTGQEFDELVADIKANGLHEDIVLHEGMILDGRNRYRACLEADVPPTPVHGDKWITDPAAYVISANIRRRHLTAEQKRELIAKLLASDPSKSDRQVAGIIKASPTTVGTVRAKMEAKGEVSKLDTRIDRKGVKQPAKKKRKRRSRYTIGGKAASPEEVQAVFAESIREIEAADAEAKALAPWLVATHPDLARKIFNILNGGAGGVLFYELEQLLSPAEQHDEHAAA